jgi:hypothetical protein
MPDVISNAPADVRLWVSLDVHKLSIVAATLPPGRAGSRRCSRSRRLARRCAGSSSGWTARRGWRSVTRRDLAGSLCSEC